MKKEFFMVFLEGGYAPRFKHETLESAEEEAMRLTKKFRRKAYVLCTIKSFSYITEDCRPVIPDLPF